VFENRVVRKISGHKRGKIMGEWTEKVAQWELHNLYSSPDTIRQSKSMRLRWAGHVTHMGEGRYTRFWWESPKERDHLED
jgi:hypothetical protein